MKPLAVLAVAVFLVFGGRAWANNTMTRMEGGYSSTRPSKAHEFNTRLRAQMRLIRKDLKSGKLTKEQAKEVWESLKTARKQELEFFRQNDHREITESQESQLNAMLGKNAGIL